MKHILTKLFRSVLPLWGLGGVLLFSSCEDFLDTRPEATTDAAGMDYAKAENIFLPVSAAYAMMRNNNAHGFAYIGLFEIAGDDADKGSGAGDNPPMQEIDNFSYSSVNDLINNIWLGCYDMVSVANHAIHEMPKFEAALLSAENRQYARECQGEAKVLRAYAYFNLVRLFGRVYIADTIYQADELANLPQRSAQEIYDFIEKDLQEAIAVLPQDYGKEWAGRINRYTALALKAKVHLYQSEWDSVAACAGKVIASGRYDLMSNYRDVFRSKGENSEESLFEIQSSTLGRSVGEATYLEYAFYQGPRGNSPTNMQGWGFCVPSQPLIDFLNTRGDTKRAEVILMKAGETYEGSPIKLVDGNPLYYNGKVFSPPSENTWTYNGYGFGYNVRVLRYADVLLMYAEALVRGGIDPQSAATAAEALNAVRDRVDLSPLAATLDNILDERRAELALEEDRFFDLVRSGRAPTVLGSKGFTAGKNEVYPIPSKQLQLNTKMTQNAGYN
ncbi:membrane protein [Bacteroidia bacterium]|nr:membrane protein [Bacteroidia bacterium]